MEYICIEDYYFLNLKLFENGKTYKVLKTDLDGCILFKGTMRYINFITL